MTDDVEKKRTSHSQDYQFGWPGQKIPIIMVWAGLERSTTALL